jgi:hypothetical protein
MQLVINGKDSVHSARLLETLETMPGHQSDVRSTYQTKTAPTADLEINFKKVKYEKIIGRGGSRCIDD